MKTAILVGDGMGDYPVEKLGGKTPLQAARIPTLRKMAAQSNVRMLQTVPDGMAPGSDVANLSLLGYDPSSNYTGRAPIEAAGAGIPLAPDDVAFRCNLITVKDGRMEDYSAGHISTEESRPLMEAVEDKLGRDGLRFYAGVSYRHLLVWRNGPADVHTQPPHDVAGAAEADHLPRGERQDELRELITASRHILRDHPVNRQRIMDGKNPATQIWLWGQGHSMQLPSYKSRYGLGGGVISAVDLVRGLGVLAGLEAPVIPGATGFLDTNFQGKVDAALDILAREDFAYLHLEAPDECGHMGDADKKIAAIEAYDKQIVQPIYEAMEVRGEPYRLILCMDHRTPVATRGHTPEPVPMIIFEGPQPLQEKEAAFDEFVNHGKAQGMSFDVIADLLKNA
jgi:2,3-bisphosphoglycerate-independent phosphoglycerate mutase